MTDMEAVGLRDSNYLNAKGASSYMSGDYAKAVEYYRLAATMGNVQAASNLGYCYLYGRSIEQNVSMAIAYFRIAALNESVDAAYKLGDIYNSGKWGVMDKEMAVYYYRMAASFITKIEWENSKTVLYCDEFQKYPSLCYALGREMMPDGALTTDIETAYQFLKHAEIGYSRELMNGARMYEHSFEGVLELLEDSIFDAVRDKYDDEFAEEYDCDED